MQRRAAFSLVELSIVLVILGLLVGGILAGQSLIRASQLRSVSVDYNKYMTANRAFRDKYFAIPGDMANATSFWTAAAVPASCATTAGTGTQTCDGDGDSMVEATSVVTNTTSNEKFRYWQHLANAGLVEGNYNGLAGSSGENQGLPGQNIPVSKITSAGFGMVWVGPTTGHAWLFDANYGNSYYFGGGQTAANGNNILAAIKSEEAWNIDTKMDDGMPASGTVLATKGGGSINPTCATNATATAAYDLAQTTINCMLVFRTGF